ncbi:MAG: BREX system P-loop protein BrxC [Acidobacteria bacterium]|nr:BREX system P-loop protein BrxC [Acidobacteriota bacterium]
MKLGDIFETRIEEKIDPVIKVGEVQDEAKLASEIGAYVVTPMIEKYIDEFLEHFTDTFRLQTSEIGAWISGYFGSGKSHLAKILALLAENRSLQGHLATKRFDGRVPSTAPRRGSIIRNLGRIDQCSTQVLAFNINTLADSRKSPLPRLLLSQYYQASGYSSNILVARTIEHVLVHRGLLDQFHQAVADRAGSAWQDIRSNLNPYAQHVYAAASQTAPDLWSKPEHVTDALQLADRGETFNAQVLVQTILDDLAKREKVTKKPARVLLVLDESGQWIEDDAGRLAQLQALVEESAIKGQGKIWIFVTTHEDMGAIYQNARSLQADMKKIEGRFRFKWSLTTENIELVLEDRIFKKRLAGKDAVAKAYDAAPGVIRGLGELAGTSQKLPDCERDRFNTFYPFFPYQVHLIPEIVKSLRSKGGRGEQLSGSTRTLLAITQDILRAGRRPYPKLEVGEMVPFDEIYGNLAGEGEVSPDVRRELSRIEEVVPAANALTRRLAEVLYLIREIAYVPRTVHNLARLLVESTSDDLPTLLARIRPELDKLVSAKLVARIGDECEFLTGERRTFEDEVATVATQLKQQDRETGLAKHFVYDPDKKAHHLRSILGFETVPFKGSEFDVRVTMDGTQALKNGHIEVRIFSPLAVLGGLKVPDLEDQSLRADEQQTIFVLCDRIPDFDQELNRFLAMREVVSSWKGDPHRSEDARKLAAERETNDLDKIERRVREEIKAGFRQAQVVFRGSSRALSPRTGQTPGETLRAELASFWPTLYPKFEKVPVRVTQEQKAILDVLTGEKNLSPDVKALRLFDKAGALDPHSPLLDSTRIYLASRQSRKERTLGKNLLDEFGAPPYGWDRNAVRVGVAGCVRAGTIKVLIGKMPHSNPADSTLQKALRDSREFEKLELVLEESEISPEVLEETRTLLMKLIGTRKIDETPAALHEAMETYGREKLARAEKVIDWGAPAGLPRPAAFDEGKDALESILALSNPMHRVQEMHARAEDLKHGVDSIDQVAAFREKWGTAFTELKAFATQLRAIEHLLPAGGAAERFLGEYETARSGARFTETEVWKQIQGAKATLAIELQTLLSSWQDEARQIVEDALDRLPADLKQQFLDEELAREMVTPLDAFVVALDLETDPVRVAALPSRARRLVDELGVAIRREVEKRSPKPPEDTKQPPQPVRETRHVRFSDVAIVRRVRTEAEWEALLKKLDDRVRALLKEFEVELE